MINYSELQKRVEGVCQRQDEKQRIEEEFIFFEKRDWEEYVSFLAEILSLTQNNLTPIKLGGSCLDSYVLRKFLEPQKELLSLLKDEKCRNILFNDALRLDFFITWSREEWIIRDLKKLDNIFENGIKDSGLQMREIITKEKGDKEEKVIISTSLIPDEDVSLIANETKESTAEETSKLLKYLIITIKTHIGI